MNSVAVSTVLGPGAVALLFCLVFAYLYGQSRQPYFRAWQVAWAAYALYCGFSVAALLYGPSITLSLTSSCFLVIAGLCIFASSRLLRGKPSVRWYDGFLALAGGLLAIGHAAPWLVDQLRVPDNLQHYFQLETGLAVLFAYCAFRFYREAHHRASIALTFLSASLVLWTAVLVAGQFHTLSDTFNTTGIILGPVPALLLGIAMLMVLFENERNAVQENALAFSTLGVDSRRLLSAEDLVPSMQNVLERLIAPLSTRRAVICISERWRTVLPSVQRGYSADFLKKLEAEGGGEYICELAYRRGGSVTFRNIEEMPEPLPVLPGSKFEQLRQVLAAENIRDLTAVSLQTREHNFGVMLFPRVERRLFAGSSLRLLAGLALQIGLTLENYVVMHEAQRRTKEYELLTQIGQAISARLDQDGVLRSVQKELGQIFDTSNFYVAFQAGDTVRYELEVHTGEVLPKRSRRAANGLTEYVIRTGQPLLIRSDLEQVRERLGVTDAPAERARCYCGAPILIGGRPAGVMAAMNTEREYVFEPRDLEIMQTAAGQVSVAVENARLFSEEQRRSRQLAFLNNISKTAISSEDSEQMLAAIVAEIQKNFRFDHIGIGILDYTTKDIEIKAEAGITTQALGKRIPLGAGIVGRVARSGESALVQTSSNAQLQGVLPNARSVLCIPVTYGSSLLGVLNVESQREDAFLPQDVLIMNTLADLLATALHNSFVFQKLQQQSITDGLTGVKTRRFCWEAMSTEWRRALRSGRPFSVVLIDLDKFKAVNDTLGHLEGDLVLARVGRLLEQRCRQSNVVARYGGDEFIILMPETGIEQAEALAERLRDWLATDSMLVEHKITGSFGVASYPVHGRSVEEIIRIADAGMYVSKHAGGNRVSTAAQFAEDETHAVQRQIISGYIEGFLQREHTGPEHLEELLNSLKKFSSDRGDNLELLRESIESLAQAAEARESNAGGHGELVARYCEVIARALGFPPEDIASLMYVARVHDVGKIFVPERILNKSGPLSEEEFYLVKMHARVGSEILSTLPQSQIQCQAVQHHHEAFDGSGYPDGLRGEEIPLWARILAIVDAYVNMTTERTFSAAKTSEQALKELEKLSGMRYDGMLVRIFLRELKTEAAWTFGP